MFLLFSENINLLYCIYRFSNTKLGRFQLLSLGFILKIFLKFHKFQSQYSYKIYSYRKKECMPNEMNQGHEIRSHLLNMVAKLFLSSSGSGCEGRALGLSCTPLHIATEWERQLTTAGTNQTTGLTNGRAAN